MLYKVRSPQKYHKWQTLLGTYRYAKTFSFFATFPPLGDPYLSRV